MYLLLCPRVIWVRGAFSSVLRQSGCEADHSSWSSAEVKHVWSYPSTLPHAFVPCTGPVLPLPYNECYMLSPSFSG
jgi:hypothetical protein